MRANGNYRKWTVQLERERWKTNWRANLGGRRGGYWKGNGPLLNAERVRREQSRANGKKVSSTTR